MVQYESLILAVPEITADEQKNLERSVEKIVKEHDGQVQSFDRWGKYRLAYPIRKNDYGVYYLVRFQAKDENKNELLKNLENFFAVKASDLVMRHIVSKLKPGQSLEYKHPESLEDTPTKDVETFLKENKMSGLMHKSNSDSSSKDSKESMKLESEKEKAQEAN